MTNWFDASMRLQKQVLDAQKASLDAGQHMLGAQRSFIAPDLCRGIFLAQRRFEPLVGAAQADGANAARRLRHRTRRRGRRAGVICQERPQRSLSQPHRPGSPPSVSAIPAGPEGVSAGARCTRTTRESGISDT